MPGSHRLAPACVPMTPPVPHNRCRVSLVSKQVAKANAYVREIKTLKQQHQEQMQVLRTHKPSDPYPGAAEQDGGPTGCEQCGLLQDKVLWWQLL